VYRSPLPLRSFLTRNNKQHKTYNIEKEKEEEEKEIRFTSTEDLFGRPTTVSRYLDWICRVASSYYYYFYLFQSSPPFFKKKINFKIDGQHANI
jgi:hypothetical protein